jgi:uncharacterized damage-inducible protein DinB
VFRRLDDFLGEYGTLTAGTMRVFDKLTDDNLGQPVAAGQRSLGQIAWHIVATIPEMMGRTGLGLSTIDQDAPPPLSAAKIKAAYQAASEELAQAIRKGWNDTSLLETDDMYGESWTRGKTLSALILHEVHHRAQITVLLRQAGERVPGVFGPAKEEWAQYGMPAPPY